MLRFRTILLLPVASATGKSIRLVPIALVLGTKGIVNRLELSILKV